MTTTVTITGPPNLMVSPDPASVIANGSDEIAWTHAASLPFSVDFNPGPFAGSHFDQNNSHSGPVVDTTPARHKYSVTVQGQALDPIIIVK